MRAAPAHGVVVYIHFPQASHHVQLVACPISLTILLIIPALQGHRCIKGLMMFHIKWQCLRASARASRTNVVAVSQQQTHSKAASMH